MVVRLGRERRALRILGSRFRGNDGLLRERRVVAGMTEGVLARPARSSVKVTWATRDR